MKNNIPPPVGSVLPPQQTGKPTNISSRMTLKAGANNDLAFDHVSDRLLNVNHWHEYAGKATATFQLTDAGGQPVFRPARAGDYFQIDIPGPGPLRGNGKDWVRIEDLRRDKYKEYSLCFFSVRPAAPPWHKDHDPVHFFSETATSTFVVYSDKRSLLAGVFGRNEKPNRKISGWLERLRAALVAVGAWLGLSYVQWKALTRGLLRG